jgi:hypothetical protein
MAAPGSTVIILKVNLPLRAVKGDTPDGTLRDRILRYDNEVINSVTSSALNHYKLLEKLHGNLKNRC